MNQQRHTNEDTLTDIFGSEEMRSPAPTEFIPKGKTAPEIAYQLVKDETYPQTQPRLNLATFVTTYMDDYATRLMNEMVRSADGVEMIADFEARNRLMPTGWPNHWTNGCLASMPGTPT